MFQKIRNLLERLNYSRCLQSTDYAFIRRYSQLSQSRQQNLPKVVLQCVEDLFYLGVFGEVIEALKEQAPLRAELYVFRSLRHSESLSIKKWMLARLYSNRLTDRKWEKIYASYCNCIAVRSSTWLSPIAELRNFCKAYSLWRKIDSKDEFATLKVSGVLIGDLVIDSYVRFKPSPEFLPKDVYVFRVLRQALRDLDKAHKYFETQKPALFLTSYTSYVQHGIPVRVACKFGIQVISFGNYQQMAKVLTQDDQTHLAQHWNYRKKFSELPPEEQDNARNSADTYLNARINGEIDNAIGYMRSSAYEETTNLIPNVKGKAILYLPDFYDSIHVYRWSVFHDYWEWACFTIDTLKHEGIPFMIKTHPNGNPDTIQVYERLRRHYPDIDFVPDGVTSKQLADAGIICGLSPRGTVLSELSYLGVPTIAGGDHPHAEFDARPPPKTVEEYRQRLRNMCKLERMPAKMRVASCEFYYMHNLSLPSDEAALRDKWLELRNMTMTTEQVLRLDPVELLHSLKELRELQAFGKHILSWANRMNVKIMMPHELTPTSSLQ